MTKLSDPANVKNLMQKSKNNAKKCQTAKVPFKMLNLICQDASQLKMRPGGG